MTVQPIVNVDFNEQDCVELGDEENGYEMLYGWMLEDKTMVYSIEQPQFHPHTGERLN